MCTKFEVFSFSHSTYILGPTNLNGYVTLPRLLRGLFVIIVNIFTMLSARSLKKLGPRPWPSWPMRQCGPGVFVSCNLLVLFTTGARECPLLSATPKTCLVFGNLQISCSCLKL